MSERWRMIKGYGHYAVSSMGRVRNLNTGKVLKHQDSRRGGNYAFINLYRDRKRVNRNVHTLVAQAFIGPPLEGFVVHHKNHNRLDPRLSNLEYVTHQENSEMRAP